MENKVPTWYNLQKRSFVGLDWCSLCSIDLESGQCLFLDCNVVKKVSAETLSILQIRSKWHGLSMEEAFSLCKNFVVSKSLRILSLIISWGIWIARNDCIFNDIHRSMLEIAAKTVGLIVFF